VEVVAGRLRADARVEASWEGWYLRIEAALPEERLLVRIEHVSRGAPVAWARPLEVLGPHPARREAPCPIHRRCGGCGLQHAGDDAQLPLKVASHLVDLPPALAESLTPRDTWVRGEPFGYRHKAILLPGGGGELRLGAFARGTHEVVDQPQCAVLSPALQAAIARLRPALAPLVESGSLPRRPPGAPGDRGLRALVLRANRAGEVLVTLVVRSPADAANASPMLVRLTGGPIVGTFVDVLADGSDRVHSPGPPRRVAGRASLVESVAGRRLTVAPLGFFQVNPAVLEAMATRVDAWLDGPDSLLDLYCGGGVLGLTCARPGARLLGVELDAEAVARARKDAVGLDARFLAAPPAEALADAGEFDAAILDPPRSGARPADLQALIDVGPSTVVYVSCHHRSLARDAERLMAAGYRPVALTPVDLMPQTPHVEWLARFER
jgi:23S rRNA (uracil1939-C5)-methyltransferase